MSPRMAFQSPPPSRSMARQGQPRNTSAPIMAQTPRKKRTTGAEPALGRNSLKARAPPSDPRTKPMISGLRYCTTPARCSPMAPAMSRSKQATQIPMFPGLPSFCRSGARMPMIAPTTMMPHFPEKTFSPFIASPLSTFYNLMCMTNVYEPGSALTPPTVAGGGGRRSLMIIDVPLGACRMYSRGREKDLLIV